MRSDESNDGPEPGFTFTVGDAIALLRAAHSHERKQLIAESGLRNPPPYSCVEDDPTYWLMDQAEDATELQRQEWKQRQRERFDEEQETYQARLKAPPIRQHTLLDPILNMRLAELREMPREADAIPFVMEHLPEFCSLYFSLHDRMQTLHWPEINLVIDVMQEVARRDPSFDLNQMETREVDYIHEQRNQDDLIHALKRTHPFYNIEYLGSVPAVASPVPAELYRQVPRLVQQMKKLPPHQIEEFLLDHPDAGRLINAIVAAYDQGSVTSRHVEDLRKFAQEYHFAHLEPNPHDQESLDNMASTDSPSGLLSALLRITKEEYLLAITRPMETLGARDIVFEGTLPVSIEISAADLCKHGEELLQRYPTVRTLHLKGLHELSVLEDILAIPEMELVTVLDLSQEKLGDYGAQILADSQHLIGCETLLLKNCGIGAIGAQALGEAMDKGRMPALATLDLAGNDEAKHLNEHYQRQLKSRQMSR